MTANASFLRAMIPQGLRTELMRRLGHIERFRRLVEITAEIDVMRAEMAGTGAAQPWTEFTAGLPTAGMTERVVEIPWVLSRYRGEQRVLDIGPAYAVTWYLRHLAGLGIPELHGVDLRPVRIRGMRTATADVRRLPYPDAGFDLILCVSTIEHIGTATDDQYGAEAASDQAGDVQALVEMGRVLRPGGRILITVPFGRRQDLPWMRQYDLPRWRELLAAGGFGAEEAALYRYDRGSGWHLAGAPSGAETNGYQDDQALAATGVLCATLVRVTGA